MAATFATTLNADIWALIIAELDPISRYALGCVAGSLRELMPDDGLIDFMSNGAEESATKDRRNARKVSFGKDLLTQEHALEVTRDNCLVDAPYFAGINHYRFFNCTRLRYVDYLYDAHSLFFYYCPKLSDIQSISNIERVTIDSCARLQHIEIHQGAKNWSIRNCLNVRAFSVFTDMNELTIVNLPLLEEVYGTGTLTNLNLMEMPYVSSIQIVRMAVVNLFMENVGVEYYQGSPPVIERIGHIRGLKSIYVINSNISLGRKRAGVEKVVLLHCHSVKSMKAFRDAQDVLILGCNNLADVRVLRNVPRLQLYDLPKVATGRSALANAYLAIHNCYLMRND